MPALSYFGRIVWAETLPDMSAGKHLAGNVCSLSAGLQALLRVRVLSVLRFFTC